MRLSTMTIRTTPPKFRRGERVRIKGTKHIGEITGKKESGEGNTPYRVRIPNFGKDEDGERTIYETHLERVR